MSESEIRDKLKNSPDEGQRILFDEYYSYVYAIALRILRGKLSLSDIEECVIDIFADIMLNFDPDNQGSLQGYVGTVAKRYSISRLRKVNGKISKDISIDSDDFGEIVSDTDVEQTADSQPGVFFRGAQFVPVEEPLFAKRWTSSASNRAFLDEKLINEKLWSRH